MSEQQTEQTRANERLWRRNLVRRYATRNLRPAEVTTLVAHRDALAGRVLELGCGAGRVTGYHADISGSVTAIDISPEMVAYTGTRYPGVDARIGDLRELSRDFAPGSFDAVAAWCNVLDVLGDGDRAFVLSQVAEILVPGGLFILNTHNLAFAPHIRRPTDVRTTHPVQFAADIARMPRAVYHRRRLAPYERAGEGYAILNDVSHDFMGLHYYASRERQEEQLRDHGFEPLECRDAEGAVLAPGDEGANSSDLHFIARRAR